MTLQSSTKARAVGGKITTTWTDVEQLWVGLLPLSGDELQIAKATDARATHELRCRYRSTVTPKMRFTHEQKFYNIKSVVNWKGENRELRLICAEDV